MPYLRLALPLLALAPLPAIAHEVPPRVAVAHADLDLRSDDGRKALDRRLKHAAGEVCLDSPNIKDVGRRQAISKCVVDLLAQLAPVREQAIARQEAQAATFARSR